MATRLYLRNTTPTASGTLPTSEQGAGTAGFTFATGAGAFLALSVSAGAAQTSKAGTSAASTSQQRAFIGGWISDALGTQDIASGTWTVNVADAENNLAANFWVNLVNVYVWRPSNGTKVATILDQSNSTSLGGTEATAINSEQVTTFTFSGAAVTGLIQNGDVLVVELWSVLTQGGATARTLTVYYDGTTTTTVENTVVSNHAAFIDTPAAVTLAFGGTGRRSATAQPNVIATAHRAATAMATDPGATPITIRAVATLSGVSSGVPATRAIGVSINAGTSRRSSAASTQATGTTRRSSAAQPQATGIARRSSVAAPNSGATARRAATALGQATSTARRSATAPIAAGSVARRSAAAGGQATATDRRSGNASALARVTATALRSSSATAQKTATTRRSAAVQPQATGTGRRSAKASLPGGGTITIRATATLSGVSSGVPATRTVTVSIAGTAVRSATALGQATATARRSSTATPNPPGATEGTARRSASAILAAYATVRLYVDGAVAATTQSRADGRFSFPNFQVTEGAHRFRVTAQSPGDNESSFGVWSDDGSTDRVVNFYDEEEQMPAAAIVPTFVTISVGGTQIRVDPAPANPKRCGISFHDPAASYRVWVRPHTAGVAGQGYVVDPDQGDRYFPCTAAEVWYANIDPTVGSPPGGTTIQLEVFEHIAP